MGPNLKGLDRNFEVINGRRRRSKMQDVVQFAVNVDVFRNVVLVKCKPRMVQQVGDVFQIARDEVVHPLDPKSLFQEAIA